MKILMLVHKFWPSIGGTQTLSLNMARRLAAKGHEVVVLTSKKPSSCPTKEWIDGVQIQRYFTQNLIGSRPWYFTPGMIPQALDVGKMRSFDIVHTFHFVTFQSMLGAFLRRFEGIPFAMNPSFHPWDGIYERTASPLIMRSASAIIAQCKQERRYLLRYVKSEKIFDIPCGIDSTTFSRKCDKEESRRKLGISSSDKIILYVGSSGARKSVEELIRIMPRVLSKIPMAKLFLVGLGSDDDSLRGLELKLGISHAVKFVGRISDQGLLDMYSAADAFAFASKNESFGIVLIEAAAAGLPIISTPVGVAPEIVSDGDTGYLCAECNIDFAERIVEVLSNERFRESALRSKEYVCTRYDWDNVVDSLESVYKAIS